MINKKQITLIQTLISNTHLRAQKDNIVSSFTNERTTHVNELIEGEARELIEYLQSVTTNKGETQRKLMIHYMHQMKWQTETGKADMKRLDNWCIKYGYLHKPLMQYNSKELPKLVTQFEGVYKSFLKSI